MWRGGFRQKISVAASSFGGASTVPPWLYCHIPLIEQDRQISRIGLSDKTTPVCFRVRRHWQFLNTYRSLQVTQSPGPSPHIAPISN
jgi:hypothetical protein